MRSCAYCGKSLDKGESCDCLQSINARRARDNNWYSQENVYTTGYTNEESKKTKRKRVLKKPNFSKLKDKVLTCIKDPLGMVFEINEMSIIRLCLLSLILSIVISVCLLLVTDIAYLGINNFWITLLKFSLGMFFFIVLINCIFSLINKIVLRNNVNKKLMTRLTSALIPFCVICVFSAILSFFPGFADLIIMLAGIILYILTIYEILKYEWRFLKTSRVMYLMASGIAILFVILSNFI